ncbi:hypothetical protein GCM10022295_51780 [Streptomyces osmaniensis]|uniref:Uncharacterized protein n=1 Tax=Streptomyces osmaniensis TaxID=593134 RepID=A0ABP6X8C5_9ACTN
MLPWARMGLWEGGVRGGRVRAGLRAGFQNLTGRHMVNDTHTSVPHSARRQKWESRTPNSARTT